MTSAADIDRAASLAHPEPSSRQKMTGNYRKGHIKLHGLDIAIESPRGSKRSGVGQDGEPWESTLPAHYGYIKRTEGADGDHVDAYIGPHVKSPKAFVIDQIDAESGDFDEHKIMLGFANREQALRHYRKAFSDDRGDDRVGAVVEMDVPELKGWLKGGETTKPVEYRKGGRIAMANGGGLTGWADLPVDADEMAARRVRGAVRPQGGRKEGALTAIPEQIAKDLVTLPARAGAVATRYGETGEYDAAPIMETAMTAMTGGMPLAQRGAAGIFGGKLAKTADHAALARAEEMVGKGANRDEIWKETGWFKGADGKWRFEISDHEARLNPNTYADGLPKFGEPGLSAGHLWHPDFYEAYPSARNSTMRIERGENQGRYMHGDKPVVQVEAKTLGDARSIGLHEHQHGIQFHEGFAPGTSPIEAQRNLGSHTSNSVIEGLRSALARGEYGKPGDQSFTDAAKQLLGLEAQWRAEVGMDAYRRSAGEVESRNVQARSKLTPEQRRANPPWNTEDVPLADQILPKGFDRGGGVDDWSTPEADDWATPEAPARPSALAKAAEPITSYPATYNEMQREGRSQIAEGLEQIGGGTPHFDPVKDAYPPDSDAWRITKGVGNVAGGALGYVGAPINAGLRTLVGKPVQENTGLPQEYSEFAASLALPGLGLTKIPTRVPVRPPAPTTPSQVVAEAAERQNVRIPRAAATDSIPVQATAGALKEVPVVGAPLVKASKTALADMDTAVDNIVSGFGSGQPLNAGQAAKEGIENWIGGKSAQVASRLYGTVDNLVDQTHTRPLHSTQRAIADVMAKRANSKIAGTSKAVDEVMDGVRDPNGMNYQGLKDLRSYIGEMTPEEMVAKGISKTEAKRIYGAMTEDLRGTVLDAGGPDALTAFDKANTAFEAIADKRKALAKIIGTKADAAPERVLARLTEMANSKGGANYTALIQARRAMGPEAWDEVASSMVEKMGRPNPGDAFSGDRFKTAWNKMPENARRIVFNSTNKPGLARDIEDIVTLSDAHQRLMRFGNPSGSARAVSLGGLTLTAWADPIMALTTAVGGNVFARVLASPVAVKQAKSWTRAYNNAARLATPASYAALGATSANLAKAISRDVGGNLTGADIMKSLQGTVPGRAEDEQQ